MIHKKEAHLGRRSAGEVSSQRAAECDLRDDLRVGEFIQNTFLVEASSIHLTVFINPASGCGGLGPELYLRLGKGESAAATALVPARPAADC